MTGTPLRDREAPLEAGCRVLSPGESSGNGETADASGLRELLTTVEGATDRSSGSVELAAAAGDWPATYALAPGRANVVRALDLPPNATVLEVGCGSGPVTRYLGEHCAAVDALEVDPAKAAVARARTRDLSGVEVFVGMLDDVPPVPAYDVVVVVGVLERVGGGTPDHEPYLTFLRRCHAVLQPGGTLVLAVGNPLGVRYLSGAADEHTGRPFDPLEGYLLESPARTFPRRALEEMLEAAGFRTEVLASFPDHLLPRVIMSDTLFRSAGHLVEAMPRFPSPDHTNARLQLADEAQTWRSLVASGGAEYFANSFVVLAQKGDGTSLWAPDRHAVMFNSERQPEFAVRSEIRGAEGDLHVARAPLYPERAHAAGTTGALRHTLAATEPVVRGRDFVQVLIDEPDRRAELLGRWAALVPDVEWAPVDLVPHNIVLTADDALVAIDQEWHLRGYDRDVLLVRGLFQSAMQMASRTRPERLRPHETVGDLLTALAADLGLPIDEELLERFLDQESDFQSRVNITHATRSARQARARDDLRAVLAQTLGDARGGERFDIQWSKAMVEIDKLYAALGEQQRNHDRAIAEFQQALDTATQEAAALRARQPSAVARRVVKNVLRRSGLRRPQ
jgi:SAM-dependent methyltransferase